jgi:hypothetical protein
MLAMYEMFVGDRSSAEDVHEALTLANARCNRPVRGDRRRRQMRIRFRPRSEFGEQGLRLLSIKFAVLLLVHALLVDGYSGIERSVMRNLRGDDCSCASVSFGKTTRKLHATLCFEDGRFPRALGHGALDVAARLFCLLSLQALDLAQDGHAVHGQTLFGDGYELDDASLWRHADGLCHEGLDQGGIALVGRGLQLQRQGVNGENIGRLEGPAKQQAGRVVDRYHDGGLRPLVARREVMRQVRDQGVLIFDLRRVSCWSKEWSAELSTYDNVCT